MRFELLCHASYFGLLACRLRRLAIDPSVEARQAVGCLERLAHHHLAISTASDGLSLRISHANRMSPDGATVDIAWDFEL
jgi:Domain of unknown function (DUF4461)